MSRLFLTIALLSVSVVASTLLSKEDVKVLMKNVVVKNLALQKEKTLTTKLEQHFANSASDPATYYVFQYASGDCSGNPTVVSGSTYNACFSGFNIVGQQIGSLISSIDKVLVSETVTSYYEFPSFDCSSPASYGEQHPIPNTCVTNIESPIAKSILPAFKNDTDIAKVLTGGILFEYYDVEDRCKSDGLPYSFTWIKLNQCVPTDEGNSMEFTSCGDGKLFVTSYSDPNCITFKSSGASLLEVCDRYDNGPTTDSGMYLTNYIAQRCT